jgi:parallel beta-helix repeat protein
LGNQDATDIEEDLDWNISQLSLYEQQSPINVTSNDDFLTQNFTGSGTLEDPYFIEGVEINGGGLRGISIVNTSAVFEIRNCSLSYMGGPYFENVSNGAIIDCELIDSSIQIIDSQYCNISGNSLEEASYYAMTSDAILLWKSNNCIVENNELYDFSSLSHDDGILNYVSENTTLRGNRIWNKDRGIQIWFSKGCLVDDCWVSECQTSLTSYNSLGLNILNSYFHDAPKGLIIRPSIGTKLQNNTLWETGMVFQEAWYMDRDPLDWDIDFQNNTVNGWPILYLYQEGETSIDCSSIGQVIAAWCSGTSLRNGDFHDTTIGVQVYHSDSCAIEDVQSLYNTQAGVQVKYSNNTVIQNCDLSFQDDYADGIFALLCNGMDIDSNTIENNRNGIDLDWEVSFAKITNNTVIFNSGRGIVLGSNSRNCTVYDNSIGGNGQNAADLGTGNMWDDGISQGNRWSDYSGFGPYELHYNDIVDNYPELLPGDWDDAPPPPVNPFVSVIPVLALLSAVVMILIVLKRYPSQTKSLAEKIQRNPT